MRNGFRIFDAHMHYAGIFKKKSQSLIEFMDENGIDRAVVNTLNMEANLGLLQSDKAVKLLQQSREPGFELFRDFRESGQPNHDVLEKLAKKYPHRIYPFFWYNPNDPNDPDQQKGLSRLDQKLQNGFCGVKIQLAMTPCEVCRLDPLASLLEERQMPMFVHPTSGLFSKERTNTFDLVSLAKNHPKLNLIVGHAAYTMEFAIEALFASFGCRNVYFETSVSIPYGIVTYAKMLGARRVVFGSDTPPAGPFELEYQKISMLRISDKAKQNILSRNIERLLRVKR